MPFLQNSQVNYFLQKRVKLWIGKHAFSLQVHSNTYAKEGRNELIRKEGSLKRESNSELKIHWLRDTMD